MTNSNALPDDDTGQALKGYIQNGSRLDQPMEIDFFAAVPTKSAGVAVSSDIQSTFFNGLPFNTSVEYDHEADAWTCYCTIVLIPSYKNIVEVEKLVDQIASRHGGEGDGFGSYGNADPQAAPGK